jgi:DNA-binding YbaB/EbfC family protein
MFGQLGELAGLMKKMGEMQSKMKKIKKELEELEVTGYSANCAVQITISGDMSVVKNIEIAEGMSNSELKVAVGEAVENVINNAKLESAKRLSEATGGMDLSALGLQ